MVNLPTSLLGFIEGQSNNESLDFVLFNVLMLIKKYGVCVCVVWQMILFWVSDQFKDLGNNTDLIHF